ncbi:hypothetical protein [Euzebya sp.]|uniref:hypothetical protein n=1 Tax=Euzebya sp. TaxID=1971409 RepID=UPI0035142637
MIDRPHRPAALTLLLVVWLVVGGAPVAGASGPDDVDRDHKIVATAGDPRTTVTVDGVFGDGTRDVVITPEEGPRTVLADSDASAAGATHVEGRRGGPGATEVVGAWRSGVGTAGMEPFAGAGRAMLAGVAPDGGCAVEGSRPTTLGPSDGVPRVLLLDVEDPADPRVVAVVAAPGAVPAVAVHPDGTFLYVPAGPDGATRGSLAIHSLADPAKPWPLGQVPLSAGIAASDVTVDPVGAWLYVAEQTRTQILDLSTPGSPAPLGRIADYMVRNHERVDVETVLHPGFGRRTFLTITARLGGGTGCATGTAYVYDITDDLRRAPLVIAQSDIPRLPDEPVDPTSADGCPTARIRLDGDARRLEVVWRLGARHAEDPTARLVEGERLVLVDSVPYDTTPWFQASADTCLLVGVDGRPLATA